MQALSLNSGLHYRSDFSKPEPNKNEALIRLSVAGICATDLELVKGYAGFSGILGHEFVGVVEAVGHDEHRHWLNRRVVGSINIGCGDCDVCQQSGAEHCQQRKVLGIRGKDGVFADYFTLPIENLYVVPDEIDDEAAVFTEPLADVNRCHEYFCLPADCTPMSVIAIGFRPSLIV
jgi:threonine dehydrogenase-like Zn-dependent dehydrogenase